MKNSLFFRGSILAFMNDSFFFLLLFLFYLFSISLFFSLLPFFPPCSREFYFEETGTVFEGKKEGGLIRWFQALVNNLLKVKSSCLVAFRDPLFFFVFPSKNLSYFFWESKQRKENNLSIFNTNNNSQFSAFIYFPPSLKDAYK